MAVVLSRSKFRPIILKRLILECGIIQAELAKAAGVHRATMNVCINRGYIPNIPEFAQKVEAYVAAHPDATQWLSGKGISPHEIWEAEGQDLYKHTPKGLMQRSWKTRKTNPMVQGDPEELKTKEVEMFTQEAMRHFKLFRSPFSNDIRDVADIYMSDEHRYIEAAMLDAARHGGFLAVIGEVGSGKSVIRKKVVSELARDDSSRIIFPRMIDKTRITAASLCDAIILDLSDEAPKMRLEQKTRQVEKLLISRSKAGCHVCLMVEEAHDLSIRILKMIKRFYEIEDGYRKAIGIILIGQPELGSLFNEADHYDMREVIRRCQVAHIRGLNGNIKDYLTMKFKRINVDMKTIMTDEAITALSNRLMRTDGRGKKISDAYPLTVNNEIIKAMNMACDMGESMVTEDVVMAI